MPFTLIKDEETGTETKSWVAPKPKEDITEINEGIEPSDNDKDEVIIADQEKVNEIDKTQTEENLATESNVNKIISRNKTDDMGVLTPGGTKNPTFSFDNFAHNFTRIIGQEVYTDFLGIGTKGAGDMGMNRRLDPNNRINNYFYGKKSESHPLDITPDQGHDYFSVENDSQWIKEASTGKVYSLKTGYLAPSYKTDKESLLKPEGPLAYLKASLYADYAPRLNKAQLEKLKANPENIIVEHPAITKVNLIKQAIENHNLISADEDKIGPTGDLGMAENRPLGWPFNKLGESWVSESGTLEERTDLKHGEGALSVVAGYAAVTLPLVLAERRLLKEFPIIAAPNRGLMDITKNSKFLSVKGLFPRIIKEATEYIGPGYVADYSLEADKANLANFFIDNKWIGSRYLEPLEIDTTDTNATRREKNASIGAIMGAILGPTIGVPLAATKGMRTDVSKFIKKAPQIASQVEDEGVRRLSNALIDILDLDAATLQEQKAIELAQQGPTTNTTKKVTGGTPPKKTEIITPKETQEELDIQQQQATIRREKAEVKAEKSTTELLQPSRTEEPKLPTKQTDTRGQGVYYHGAANKFELDESSHYNKTGLYGHGLYTTEDLTTAGKYQKKNRKSAGKDATQVVYQINEKQPVKFFDLDKPAPKELLDYIEAQMSRYEFLDDMVGNSFDAYRIGSWQDKVASENPSLAELFSAFKEYNTESPNTAEDFIFQIQEYLMSNEGGLYGGYTHQGGKKAGKGKRLHQVKIYWEPYEQVTLTPLENLSKKELVTKTKKLLSTFDETKFRKAQEGKGLSEQEINERANYLKRLAQNEDVSSEINLFPLGDDGPTDPFKVIQERIIRLIENNPKLQQDLEAILKEADIETARITGMELKASPALQGKMTRQQALDYGDPRLEGLTTLPTGTWNATKQLIYISLSDHGFIRNREGILNTVWHENMHALQDYFYTPTQKKLLAANRKKLKQIALEGLPEKADTINKFGFDKTTDRELQAFAFAAWRELGAKYEKATWAEPFRKIQQILTKVSNALRGYGYNTLEDLLADSGSGNIRQRALKTKRANTGISFELDPEDLIKRQDAFKDAVDKGDMPIDKAMESMTRPLVSRTGKTTYLPRTSDQLIYANASLDELLREMLGDRETLTGLKSYKIAPLLEKAKAQLKADGLDPKLTLQRFEQAAKGDLRSQDDLIAMTALLAHHDINLRTLSENSIEFRGAKNATDKLNAGKKMIASFEDHVVLSTGWAFATRNASQRLKLGQISFTDSVNETIPPSTIFRQNVESDLVSDSILKDGFTTTNGIAGEGVYFTTDSTPGNVEINGPLPADIPILNLAGSNKSITDLLIELKLGKPKKAKDGVTLTPKQQEAIKNYAENKGYKGIRYATDFTSKPQSGDQVVIFDPNDANRIVRSAAAIPPEKVDTEPVSSLIEQAIRNTTKVIENKLPKGAREALKEGRMTPELLRILDAMSAVAYELNDPQSLTRSPIGDIVELINDVPKGKLTEETWYDIWRNWLFLSASTMMKVFGGTEFRAAVLPVTQWMGEARLQRNLLNKFDDIGGNMNDFQMSMSKVRQRLYLSQYPRYFQQLPYALRMAYSAIKHNEVFVNLGRGEFDEFRKNYSDNTNQLELDFNPQTITEDPVTLTGKEWWLDPSSNPLSLMWRHGISEPLRTGAGRLLAGIDSFHSGMVGPTSEFTRLMEMNIAEIAMRDNLNPETHFQEIYESAFEKTNLQLKKLFAHIRLKDGTMIEKGRLKGQHAKNVMDWIQFTDDISVKNEARTFEYGVRAAKEEGLTDKREIFERALTWIKEGEQFERYSKGDKATFGGSMEAMINMPGELWQKLLNNSPGHVAYLLQATNRTPVNMTKSALRVIPGANNYVDSYWRDIHSQDYGTRAKALGEISLAQNFLGMAAALSVFGVVEISGPLPVDQKKRNEWKETGKQPESIRFKLPWNGEYTRWFPTDTFEQLRIVLTAAGAYTDVLEDCNQKESDAWFGYCALTSVAPAISKTGLNIFQRDVTGGFRKIGTLVEWFNSEITDELKGDQNKLEKFILQFLTGTGGAGGPAVVKAARYSIDPYERDYDTGSNILATSYNMWKRNIPYLSKTAPLVLNSYTGNPIPAARVPGSMLIDEESSFIKAIHDQMTPLAAFRGRHQSTDPIDEERLRMGSNRLLFGRRSSGLPNRTLNRTELNRLIEIATKEIKLPYPPGSKTKPDANGLTLPQALRKMITESVRYKSLPYENKKGFKSDRDKAWDDLEQRYKQLAMEYFIEEMDDGTPESLGYQLKLFKQQKEIKEKTRFSDYDMSINSLEDWKQLAQA